MEMEISCGFVLINADSQKILLLKLSDESEWDIPKGHQEKGETNIETAFREVEEEVKIKKSQIAILQDNEGVALVDSYEYVSPVSGNTRKIVLFVGKTKENPIISHEHCGFAWCTLKEGLKYLRFSDVQGCVNKLYEQYVKKSNYK